MGLSTPLLQMQIWSDCRSDCLIFSKLRVQYLCEPIEGGHPFNVSDFPVGIANSDTLVFVVTLNEIFIGSVSNNVLVVTIVKQVSFPRCPSVLESRVLVVKPVQDR